MAKLIFLAGSTKNGSVNVALAKLAEQKAKALGAQTHYIDLKDHDMPIFNEDLEAEIGKPEGAKTLKKLFVGSDGFFIASPEYNGGYSPLLKNALDWISRGDDGEQGFLNAFMGKAGAISAASPGATGGMRGLVQLRMLLGNIGAHLVPSQVAVASAHDAFDETGDLKNDQLRGMLDTTVKQLVDTANALHTA